MSKPIALGALLVVALTCAACAPSNATAFRAPNEGRVPDNAPIPATYYPTATPIPTWTPLPRPAQALPTVPLTVMPTDTATPEPVASPTLLPPSPTATFVPVPTPSPVLIPLPAVAPMPSPTPAPSPTPVPTTAEIAPRALAAVANPPTERGAACPVVSGGYDLVPIEGAPYKNNALSDYNADLRLSVIGIAPTEAPLSLVDYNGPTDPDAPKLYGLFQPNRVPTFLRAYLRFDWLWNESQSEPYGARGGLNLDWPVAAVEMATQSGETIYPPARGPVIYSGGTIALVLFAAERELTLGYSRHDDVGVGYVVHLLNLCVDSGLVALYRAQLSGGRRATGHLPAVRNGQPVGVSFGALIVAVRDRGAFLDPRSRKDWW